VRYATLFSEPALWLLIRGDCRPVSARLADRTHGVEWKVRGHQAVIHCRPGGGGGGGGGGHGLRWMKLRNSHGNGEYNSKSQCAAVLEEAAELARLSSVPGDRGRGVLGRIEKFGHHGSVSSPENVRTSSSARSEFGGGGAYHRRIRDAGPDA